MSTKIYHGCRFPEPLSNEELLSWSKGMREKILSKRKDHLNNLMSRMTWKKADELYMSGEKFDIFEVKSETNRYFEDMFYNAKHKGIRGQLVDFDFSLVVFPNGLCMPYINNVLVQEVWQEQIDIGIVARYGYWDNVDPDEVCTDEQWDQRKKDWSEALYPDMDGIPCYNGITVEVVSIPYWDFFELSAMEKHKPLKEDRAKYYSENKITYEIMEDLKEKDSKENNSIRYLREATELLKNDLTYKKKYGILYKECLKKLPDTYIPENNND